MERWLEGRTFRVRFMDDLSGEQHIQSGVPQGSVLGPLLFLIYVNYLPTCISQGTRMRLYADDALMYRPIGDPTDCTILQHDLDKIHK